MDFDLELTQIQGALMKANNIFPFKNILGKDDTDDAVKCAVDILYNVFVEKKYLNEAGVRSECNESLRRITLFLILNCDLKVMDELVNNDDIGHLVWVTPTITKYLLIHLIWGLRLERFYCEAIQYCCPKLSLELLRTATQNVKHCTLEKSVESTRSLITGIYGATHRLLARKEGFRKSILNGYYESLYELIKYFGDSPHASTMAKWSRKRLYVQAGNTLLSLFRMAVDCFKIFSNKGEQFTAKDYGVYFLTYEVSSSDSVTEKYHDVDTTVDEFFLKYNDIVTSAIIENVKSINVDVYCSWSEHSIDDDPDNTLQKAIGESAYDLHTIIISDARFNSEVATLLLPISVRPLDLSDIIEHSDKKTMLQKCNEPSENQAAWLIAVSQKPHLLSDKDYMNCLCSNIELLTDEIRRELFEKGIDMFLAADMLEYSMTVKNLTLKCFTACSIEYKKIALWNVFSGKPLGSWLESDNYDAKITEVLNKFTVVNDEMTAVFLDFFVQNPYKLYIRVLERCAENKHALHLLNVLEIFKDMYHIMFIDFHPEMGEVRDVSGIELLIVYALKAIKIDNFVTEFERLSFERTIQAIISKNIVSSKPIVNNFLMAEIDFSMPLRNFRNCVLYMKCMASLYEAKLFIPDVVPILVRFAQILEAARWCIFDYTSAAVELVQSTTEFQQKLVRYFIGYTRWKCKEHMWALKNLKFMSPLNFYYYQDVFPFHTYCPLLVVSYSCKVLSYTLCYLLPRTTLTEWKMIYVILNEKKSGIRIFQILCDALVMVSSMVNTINSTTAYSCLEYCGFNLAIILQEKILPLRTEADRRKLLNEFVNYVNSLPIEAQSRSFYSFLIPMSTLLEPYILDTSSDGIQNLNIVKNIIENLYDESFRDALKGLLEHEKRNY